VRFSDPGPTASWGCESCVAVACSVSRDLRYATALIRIAARNARCWRLFTGAGASCSSRCLIRSSPAPASVTRATVVFRFTQSALLPHRHGALFNRALRADPALFSDDDDGLRPQAGVNRSNVRYPWPRSHHARLSTAFPQYYANPGDLFRRERRPAVTKA
jgi:hypothetical protein